MATSTKIFAELSKAGIHEKLRRERHEASSIQGNSGRGGNIVNWRVCVTGAFVYVNGELWSEDIFQIATRFMPDKNQLAEFERIIAPLKER